MISQFRGLNVLTIHNINNNISEKLDLVYVLLIDTVRT